MAEEQTPQDQDDSAKWAEFFTEDEEISEPVLEPAPESPAAEEDQETQPAPSEPPAPEPPAPEPPAPELPAPEQLKEYREKFITTLEAHYALDEEQANALQLEPEKVLPKLAAKLHMEVLNNVVQHMHNTLPDVIRSYVENSSREAKAQEEFYSAWPELRGHEQQVLQMGQVYRQMNPTASPQEAIQRIGEMTMAALGKKRAQVENKQPPVYRPAAPGRVGTPPPAKTKWEALFDDE